MKFDLKNKFRGEKKEQNSKVDQDSVDKSSHEKQTEDNLKTEMISSILKGGVEGEEDRTITFADLNAVDEELQPKKVQENQVENNIQSKTETKSEQSIQKQVEKTEEDLKEKLGEKFASQIVATKSISTEKRVSSKTTSTESEKISRLIKAIEASQEKKVIPSVEMDSGKISYMLLSQIGEDVENLDFLEKLASPSFDILERTIHERLVVCPEHPESLSTSVRLNCPRCSSVDISKLHLIEHKRCGYISENKNYEISANGQITKCPSCKKPIQDTKREIAMPAMWYSCNECKEKFDDVSVKLYCRKYNHDFEISNAHSVLIPNFSIKNLHDTSNASISPILKSLKKLLGTFGFSADENYTVTGKSGNSYRVNIYGEDEHQRTIFIYIKNPNAESDNSELNSKIIEVLDTSPSVTILIGFPSISEKAKAITSNYNISLITQQNPDKILSSIKDILSQKVPPIES